MKKTKSKITYTFAITALLLIALILLPLAGCGSGTVSESPSEVVNKVFQAYNTRDFEQVYTASSLSLKQKTGSHDVAIAQLAAGWPEGSQIVDLKVTDEKIDGDKATASWSGTVKAPGKPDQPGQATINLVMENGAWKIDQAN